MTKPRRASAQSSLDRHIWIGLAVALVFARGLSIWAATTEISGAVIAPGLLVVESSVKKIPTGGVVGELLVHEGDHVKEGDVLLRLDDTETRANLGIITRTIDELTARDAGLEAETVGADSFTFPDELLARKDDPIVAKLLDGEQKLFKLRKNARVGQKAQLRERINQLGKEISGLTEQADAKEQEIALVNKELEGVKALWEKNLVQLTRLTALQRDAARLSGERGQLVASIAEAKGKIAEVELQVIQVDEDMRSDVAQKLSEDRAKLSELSERKVAAEDQLKRVTIHSPQDGVVQNLEVHGAGAVVSPGQPIMLIVPEADKLTVDARVSPTDIDQVKLGQHAMLHFSAFDVRTTPEIPSAVARIGADLTQDEKTGARYYLIRVTID
jgi:membrane fusion protein, type I secretion system